MNDCPGVDLQRGAVIGNRINRASGKQHTRTRFDVGYANQIGRDADKVRSRCRSSGDGSSELYQGSGKGCAGIELRSLTDFSSICVKPVLSNWPDPRYSRF